MLSRAEASGFGAKFPLADESAKKEIYSKHSPLATSSRTHSFHWDLRSWRSEYIGYNCEEMACYLSTFKPLCFTAAGRQAVARFRHPPFVDASCRREPDFESPYPSISTICHGDLFAPRLRRVDRIAFLTVKRHYPGHDSAHWRLVAALEVAERFETHQAAADWYHAQALPLPSNCMVRENAPLGVEHTAEPRKDLREWDLGYWKRTRRTGVFLACRALRLRLHEPPVVTKADLIAIFGKVPVTRNPPSISETQFDKLVCLFS